MLYYLTANIRNGKNDIKWLNLPPIGYLKPPQWLKAPYTSFYKQTNNPFYKPTAHFYSFWLLPKLANSKREKWYKNGPFWVLFWLDLPLQGLLGSYWVTHRWGHHLPLIRAQLCQDWSRGAWDNWLKLDLGGSIIHRKWDKNDKKRLKIAKSILFHIHKHCTTSFSSQQFIFSYSCWLLSKVANLKREKTATIWYKMIWAFKGLPIL